MERENTLLPNTIERSCSRLFIGRWFVLFSIGIALITGCDLDRDRDAEPPMIEKLESEMQVIKTHGTTTIVAEVSRNEDPDLQYEYAWSTTGGGKIQNNGAQNLKDDAQTITVKATYIAPETAGTYIITLKVRTRYAVVERSTDVAVTNYAIEIFPVEPWKANGSEQSLAYRFCIEAIRHSPILLEYKIQQTRYQPTADLVVNMDKGLVYKQKITESNALEAVISVEKDITPHINRTGQYELTFTLQTTKDPIRENTWFLKKIKIVGVEGDFLP